MEISLIYNLNQKDVLLNSGFKPEMLYFLRGTEIPDEEWERIDKTKLTEFPGIIDILKEIGKTKSIIDPVVDDYVSRIEHKELRELVEYVTKSPSWRERPLIIRLAANALGYEYADSLVHVSAGIELFEESAILLDDVLDEATMCVGKETTWIKYGIKDTFIAHGLLTSLARSALLEGCRKAGLTTQKSEEVMNAFEEIYYSDYVGQYVDMSSERNIDFSENDYFKMISRTPGTQFANALVILSIFTNREDVKENLREFGRNFGMAAQLRDDIIDIIGNEKVVYKKLFTDILRKKKKLPLILFLQRLPEYRNLFNDDIPINEKQLSEIISRIHDYGIIDMCISRVKNLTNSAIKSLKVINENYGKNLLVQLANLLGSFNGT
ncbi:MAG: polyprenyl synthetase family protein [Deltaproteobacteria bacterium]|nr:polyprenyl synthetase family protein [Deltaproteobacteria bacterium]